ncbi:MAG TPA: HdeD family acid-resistance protein [Streptosporangiaceae bacterium]|nr:HdeD family acid-resistance protein [Streptosporangiaceae bacterium]
MSTPQSGRPGQASQPGTSAAGEPIAGYPVGETPEMSAFGREVARGAWPAFLAAGIGSLVVGVLLLAWPTATLTIAAVLIGISLIVAGVLQLMNGFTAPERSGGRRAANIVIGLLAIIVGLYCIRHYHVTIAALAVIVGLFWVIHGIGNIAAGLFSGPRPGRGVDVFTGVLSLAAGLIVLFWPTISITVLVVVIGVWLVVYGLMAMIMAFMLRRGSSASTGPGRTASV